MPPELKPVRLEDLSKIESSFWVGVQQGGPYPKKVLVIRYSGKYGFGSGGNDDATFMCAMGMAAIEAFDHSAVIIDLSGLSYEWGDMMEEVLSVNAMSPKAYVVGPNCRRAISTLLYGVDTARDACESEYIFDSLDDAWAHVTRHLSEGDLPAIHRAAKDGDLKKVEQLLASGEDVNRQDSWFDETPLHRAATPEIVQLLIEAGANVNAASSGGMPLFYARSVEIASLLLKAGADPDARTEDGTSALDHVESAEIAQLLIDAGADVQLRRRSSLLHKVWKPEIAHVLIAAGVEVNALDEQGHTPLDTANAHYALYRDQAERFPVSGPMSKSEAYARIVALLRANGAKTGAQRKAERASQSPGDS